MSKFLLVPVHLDALYLQHSKTVAEATADFRRLPYFDRKEKRDVNSDTPWLGEAIASPPFENSNLTLQAGMHLHWALPDGLCHGEVDKSQEGKGRLMMPKVPDRWLIRRRKTDRLEEKSWIVESNYLWPESHGAPAVNIFWPQPTITTSAASEVRTYRPYRFLGRKQTLEEWQSSTTEVDAAGLEYWQELTAIGHGEPTFAAYYPNCATIFGYHDRDFPEGWQTVHYDLMGWYGQEVLRPPLTWESVSGGMVEPKRQWRIGGNAEPEDLVCYASIEIINSDGDSSMANPINSGGLSVAIGNTISEALSALVAQEVATELEQPNLVSNIEEQLESLYIADQLASEDQDLGLRLRRYRHEKSFDAIPGGDRWTIQATPPGKEALPSPLAIALRQLNNIQSQCDRQGKELGQARRQLYGDWCNYMRNMYRPPDGGKGKFLDIDAVVSYIQTRSLGRVNHLAGIVQTLETTLAHTHRRLEVAIAAVNDANRNRSLAEIRAQDLSGNNEAPPLSPTQYELNAGPGIRFWQPTDPVVLITGDGVKRSDRHGHDGRHAADGLLTCKLYTTAKQTADAAFRDKRSRVALLAFIEQEWDTWHGSLQEDNSPPGDSIGCRKVDTAQPTWNPLFLDWGIDMYPAEVRAPQPPETASPPITPGYNPKVITENYQLGSQYPDLQQIDPLWVHNNPDRLSGRCILGDTVDLILRGRIEDFLSRQLQDRLSRLWQGLGESPRERGNIVTVVDRWIAASPDDTAARDNFGQLVELWANPDSEDETDQAHVRELATWYKKLAGESSLVSLEALPKTPTQLNALVDWYQKRPKADAPGANGQLDASDPILYTLLAYRRLFDNTDATGDEADANLEPRAFVSQSLSGFNGELMQWKLGLMLPIDEPVGLSAYREFTQQVAEAMGDEAPWATEPTNQFSPLRSGALVLGKLRLIDSFGQVSEVPCEERVIVPSPYRVAGRPGAAFLPPRLVQPARVTFRWLDTGPHRAKEMVEAEARSPICGWLLRDRLSSSLLVFDGEGTPLGSLIGDRTAAAGQVINPLKWVQAPGRPSLSEAACEAGRQHLSQVSATYYNRASAGDEAADLRDLGELGASIANGRLARVLLYLWATRSLQFLDSFLNTLDNAMANIDPEGVASMGSLALLVGRPVAVLGAELNLELQQEPAVRQDWEAFRLDLFRHHRDSYGFDQVRFRLRLGQYQSRNDGIVGYWLEQNDGFAADTFVAQAANDDDPSLVLELDETLPGLNARINAHDAKDSADDLNFTQAVADSPLRTTLLFDPRGKAHLTTGILPVKAINIPRSLWEPALEALQLWLPVAPIVTSPDRRQVPFPTLVDHQWSWLERVLSEGDTVWQTLEPRPSLNTAALAAALVTLQADYPQHSIPTVERLVALGWLAELPLTDDRLYLGRRDDRQPLDELALEAPLDRLLANLSLALVSPGEEPNFNPGTEVREGWLLLKPSNSSSNP